MKSMIAFAFALYAMAVSAAPVDPCGADLEKWLSCNNPRVVEYLKKLGPHQVGEKLKGVALTDGTIELANAKYLGTVRAPKGVHAFLFETQKKRVAYLWVDEGSKEFALPNCPDQSFDEHSVLSGDVYTWRAAQPGDGIIKIECPPDEWRPT